MRTFVVACISVLLLVLVAVPAVAQRDPFAPRSGEGSQTQNGGQTEDGEGRGAVFQPSQDDQEQPRSRDPLPQTGGEVTPWLITAYVLGALGTGVIVLARSFGPQARSRRS